MKILFQLNKYNQQRQHEKAVWIFPIKLAMYATYLRNQGHEICWDSIGTPPLKSENWDRVITFESQIDVPFLELPHADRILTDAKNYKWQQNGNFKYHPGTYLAVANGCWWGKCTFCVENGKPYEVRPVDDCIAEIEEIKALGFKEVFDDSGTFPMGNWLERFLDRLGNRNNRVAFGCNTRILDYPFKQMKQVGFRMLLFGIESANQQTLDKISKGVKVEDIIPTIKKASEAGLEPHVSVIFGYPWETDDDANRTLRLLHYLLRKGYAKTAQASFYTQQGIKGSENHRRFIRKIYNVKYSPEFWFNQLKDIKDIDNLKYLWRKIKVGLKEGL